MASCDEPGPEPRRLVLVRHGRTAWNAVGRAQGHENVELDGLGREQAETTAPALAGYRPVALWSSDLARARQTAALVEKHTGLTAAEDPRLREYGTGARTGLTIEEFADRFPREHAEWRAGANPGGGVPGAETPADVRARLAPALEEIVGSIGAGECGVVVAHGACLKIALELLLGWPEQQSTTLAGLENGGWAVLEELAYDQRWRLAAYNLVVG